ncbi:MAG: GGDEF domain-containing protein [Acidobacteria bacterium]|nr:MAG: GGDEF domain-containing protein [Acidobacteriota bacterium]
MDEKSKEQQLMEQVQSLRHEVEQLKSLEGKYRNIFLNAVEGIFQSTPSGRFLVANPALARILGYASPEDLIAERTDIEKQHYVEPQRRREFQQSLDENSIIREFEYQVYRKDGTRIWVSETCRAVRDASGAVLYYEGTIQDITHRRSTEEALQEANEQLASWVNELQQRTREMTLLSEMGDLLQACLTLPEAYVAIGQIARQLFAPESGTLSVTKTSQNLVEVVAAWGPALGGEPVFTHEGCWALRRGRVHHIEDSSDGLLCKHLHRPPPAAYICVPMMAQGEALGILHLGYQEVGRLTESKQRFAVAVAEHVALALSNLKLHETLRSQSIRDPLTGLFNRRFMEESLVREVLRAARNQGPLGVIMIDLDGFKSFNDTFGHDAGDTLLREFGFLLRNTIRAEDIACRYGGEEFTLILPEATLEATLERAEQIREEIKRLKVLHRDQDLGQVTVSLGVAVFPNHGTTGEALLRAADTALYRAKIDGRDRVAVKT